MFIRYFLSFFDCCDKQIRADCNLKLNLGYKLKLNDAAGHYFVDNTTNRLYKWNYRKDTIHFLDLDTIIP